jgi:hypothetical protein
MRVSRAAPGLRALEDVCLLIGGLSAVRQDDSGRFISMESNILDKLSWSMPISVQREAMSQILSIDDFEMILTGAP